VRFQQVERRLRRRGYSVKTAVRDASAFGVPQRRQRLIMIAITRGRPPFPAPSKVQQTVRNAIGRMSPPQPRGDPLHNPENERSDRVTQLIASIPHNGGSRSALPDHLVLGCHRRVAGFHDVYGRMRWDEPAPTITGGCINPSKGRFLHPSEDRAITLREAARLQGFPARYTFSLRRGKYRAAELIGNAFPPEFARRHAAAIGSVLACQPPPSALGQDLKKPLVRLLPVE
jgi:DNA (cytosine-5)-methyltransferase 1